jgi:hypothetical protein
MTTVIGLTGHAQVGKDTVGELLGKYGFERLAFADALRDGLYALNPYLCAKDDYYEPAIRLRDELGLNVPENWNRLKNDEQFGPEVRRLLQVYGTESGRDIHGQTCWTDIIERQLVRSAPGDNRRFVITDVRFPNEVELVHGHGGQVWRLDRVGTGPVNAHVSDKGLGPEHVDSYLVNNGSLHDLATTVDYAVGQLL